MFSEMKTTVIDYSKGKFELLTMDDQMPIFIYIVAMTKIPNLSAELNLLWDYIKFQEKSYDTEQFLVTNLQVNHKICYLLIVQHYLYPS